MILICTLEYLRRVNRTQKLARQVRLEEEPCEDCLIAVFWGVAFMYDLNIILPSEAEQR